MGFPKLGSFKKIVWQICEERDIKKLDFEILLWLSEQEWASQYEIKNNVPCSQPSVMESMRRLERDGWVRIVRKEYVGRSRKYSVSRKTRLMVTGFYMKIESLQ
jgi:DNA-binding PadR family transcriptional regulator